MDGLDKQSMARILKKDGSIHLGSRSQMWDLRAQPPEVDIHSVDVLFNGLQAEFPANLDTCTLFLTNTISIYIGAGGW